TRPSPCPRRCEDSLVGRSEAFQTTRFSRRVFRMKSSLPCPGSRVFWKWRALTLAAILFSALPVFAETVPGSLPAQWNIGAEDCAASPQPPLQVHSYEPTTF